MQIRYNTEKVRLGDVAKYINGRAFKPAEWESVGLPIIRIQNLSRPDASYNYTSKQFEEKYRVKYGDLLFAWSASLGAYIWKGGEAWLNQHIFRGEPFKNCNKKYLFYSLERIVADLYSKAHGSGMVHVTKGKFEATEIPLPPLAEQERIVAKIEELFSELDAGKQEAEKALQQLKTYRQAVLKWAFEGRLTNEHVVDGELPEGWRRVKFGEIHKIKSNLVDPKDFGDFPHIAPDNITKGTGQLLEYRTIKEDGVFSPKHRFFKGQIVYSKIRPNLAKVIIASFDGLCSADMYPIESSLDNRFTYYYMLSKAFVDKASNTESRTVLPKINQKGLNEIDFPLCSLQEQHRIVQEIEGGSLFATRLKGRLRKVCNRLRRCGKVF